MDAHFYKGYGNEVILTLKNDGVVVPMAALTSLEFIYSGGSINSSTNPELFDFDANSVRLKFGDSALQKGTYAMSLIVYSTEYPSGVVWDDSICVKIDEL
jgi:hypothetical protein